MGLFWFCWSPLPEEFCNPIRATSMFSLFFSDFFGHVTTERVRKGLPLITTWLLEIPHMKREECIQVISRNWTSGSHQIRYTIPSACHLCVCGVVLGILCFCRSSSVSPKCAMGNGHCCWSKRKSGPKRFGDNHLECWKLDKKFKRS